MPEVPVRMIEVPVGSEEVVGSVLKPAFWFFLNTKMIFFTNFFFSMILIFHEKMV